MTFLYVFHFRKVVMTPASASAILGLFSLLIISACHTGQNLPKSQPTTAPVLPKTETLSLVFADTLLENRYPKNLINSNNILNDRSKIRSTQVATRFTAFNLGLIDFNGNGVYTDETDFVTITVPDNRGVRIMADNGTPHCLVKDSLWVLVDTVLMRLTDIKPDGSSATLIRPGSHPRVYPDLVLRTYIQNIAFTRYTQGVMSLDSMVALKPYTFVFFWNTSRIVEYQIEKLKEIEAAYKDQVTIIGVHCKDHELDKETEGNFFKMMAYPWCGTYCTLDQYHKLNQDYAWFRGLLISRNKKILYPHMSPKELQRWLEEARK